MLAGPVTVPSQEPERRFPRPAARYGVRVERSVMLPMRDGVRLSTDLYFPEGAGEKLPVIMIRTPYNKKNDWDTTAANMFAGQGYVVAVQDVRGKFESEGDYVVSAADTSDGYDALGWLAAQAWSTGKVGTYGCSYSGENQVEMAKLRHPNHAAMIPKAAGGSFRYFAALTGGAFELASSSEWFLSNGARLRPVLSADAPRADFVRAAEYWSLDPVPPKVDWKALWKTLPVINMLRKAGAPPTDFEGFASHGPGDPYWDQFGYVKPGDRFDTPALFVDSWSDYGGADALALFNLLRRNSESARARENQFVIVAPTLHCAYEQATAETVVGEREIGDAQLDYYGLYLKWFDHWLKGIDTGVTEMPRLQLYAMGRNQWRGEREWPLARTAFTRYYLHSDGAANSRFGTGVLSTAKPGNEPPDRFVYDPRTPVPSVGGPDFGAQLPDRLPGAMDQSEVEARHDVLVYTTPPLAEGIEVTGPIGAVLHVSSSARDTDFTAKLVDVYPDGAAYNVQEGILRARYREGFGKTVFMKPGMVYEVRIDLQATSNFFAAGHRIRLEVSSSNFPRFDRNLNTGGSNYDETGWVVARNAVHHSSRYPSHLMLPVIP